MLINLIAILWAFGLGFPPVSKAPFFFFFYSNWVLAKSLLWRRKWPLYLDAFLTTSFYKNLMPTARWNTVVTLAITILSNKVGSGAELRTINKQTNTQKKQKTNPSVAEVPWTSIETCNAGGCSVPQKRTGHLLEACFGLCRYIRFWVIF